MFLPSVAVGQLISQSPPAESVAGPGYGPLVLILAQMIDSPGAETTGSALWLAVNMLLSPGKEGEREESDERNRRGRDWDDR